MKPFSRKENQGLQEYKKINQNIKTKVGRWKHFRKWFWSYLKVKNNCFEGSDVIFWGKKLKSFSWKANQSLQNGFILMFARGSILEIGFEATLKSKTICSKRLKIDFYFPFHIFQWTSSKCFWGKKDETYKTVNPKSDIENVLENGFGTTL